MKLGDWLRPPRHLMVVFLVVALVSGTALAWFAWLLLEQDKTVEAQQRLEQAADRASAAIQRALTDLDSYVGSSGTTRASVPAHVTVIALDPSRVDLRPTQTLPYLPIVAARREAPPGIFATGETLEFAVKDLRAAANRYSQMATDRADAVRAGALVRLARVQRQLPGPEQALITYNELAGIEGVFVDSLPSGLVARLGRIGLFEATGRRQDLKQESAALRQELEAAKWPLLKAQYEDAMAVTTKWLPDTASSSEDALIRAEAVHWLWQNRSSLDPISRRSVSLTRGTAYIAWSIQPDRVSAVVAGPVHLAALAQATVPAELRITLTTEAGGRIVGESSPARRTAIRTAAFAGLPWTLHVFAASGDGPLPASPRQQQLLLVLSVVAVVLVTGWYFIVRGMSRELRVARLQSDFVAAVSHEFRSPLTSLNHIAEMLAEDRFPTDELRRRSYEILRRDGDRLRRLVEGLLDMGRLEAGATLHLERLDLGECVRTLVADFQARVAADGVVIHVAGAERAIYARVDREALPRALWNLLDNAVRYSPDRRTVWVEVQRLPHHVTISVRDEGLGIPAREQSGVFDPFVRGHEAKVRRISGTGIGLAMVREIVRIHGGEIQLVSEEGRGSTFTVLLSTEPDTSSEAEGHAESHAPTYR